MSFHDCASAVAAVQRDIGNVVKTWDASNLESVASSESVLLQAASNLQRVHDLVARGTNLSAAVRGEMLAIVSTTCRFLSVIDAGSVFMKGVSSTVSDLGVSYDAAGAVHSVRPGEYGQEVCRTY